MFPRPSLPVARLRVLPPIATVAVFASAVSILVAPAWVSAAPAPEPSPHAQAGGQPSLPDPRPRRTALATATVTVPLDYSSERPVVEATINGKGPYRFIVDTGAGVTTLDQDFVKEVGLPSAGESRIGDPMQPQAIRVEQVELAEVAIGGATFSGVSAVALDRARLGVIRAGVRGVLGFPLFSEVLVTFDGPAGRMRIERGELPEPDGRTLVAWSSDHGIPQVDLRVAGETISAHLDTGSPSLLTIPSRYKDRLPLDGPLVEAGRGRTVASEFVVYAGTLDTTLSFGGHDWVRPSVRFNDQFPVANVGTGMLRAYAMTFDQKNRRARFTVDAGAAATALAAARPSRYGLRLSLPPAVSQVAAVVPGSPAERGGVQAGDVVLAMNGEPFDSLTPERRRSFLLAPTLALRLQRGDEVLELTLKLD